MYYSNYHAFIHLFFYIHMYRSVYQQCLYLECTTNLVVKYGSLSSWNRISCGLEQRVIIIISSSFTIIIIQYVVFLFNNNLYDFWLIERTEKIPMGSIKNVVTEPIEGHEDYHMMVCLLFFSFI